MSVNCPSWSPPINQTYSTHSGILTTIMIMWLPLQRLIDGEKFCMRIKGQLILILNSLGGRLVDFTEWRIVFESPVQSGFLTP